MDQIKHFHKFVKESNGNLRLIKSQTDLKQLITDRKTNPQITSGFLAFKGAQPLEHNLDNLQEFYDNCVRLIGITHFFDNQFAGSAQ